MEIKQRKEFQAKWDSLLIKAWSKDFKMAYVSYKFFEYVEKKLGYNVDNLKNKAEFLESLNLKRWCTGFNADGSKRIAVSGLAREFVGRCSIQMSGVLFDSPLNAIDVLLNISNYKWSIPNGKVARKKYKAKLARYKKADQLKEIKERSLSPDWNTVS